MVERSPALRGGSTTRPEWGVNAAIEADLLRSAHAKPNKESRKQQALRVLLVGNSYTRFNLLHMLIERIAESAGGPRVHIDVEARPGYSLRMHLKTRSVLNKIRNGRYSHVVLQGHSLSAVDHPDELVADAERLHTEITASGSRTVLYETWARKPNNALYKKHAVVHSFEDMVGRIDRAYSGLARQLGAGLAPVGGAFERAWRADPQIALWGGDGSHPTLAGSYMAACVLYGAITGRDPREADWAPYPIGAELAQNIRSVAATTLAGVPNQPLDHVGPDAALAADSGARGKSRVPAASAKLTKVGNKPTPGTGQVAASIAAMMGRAPGETEAPDTVADEPAAGGDKPVVLPGHKPTEPAFLDDALEPLGPHAATGSNVHTF
ncbi:MAG TPA: hypothetical protein VJR89_01300 [Polyangiales bacterium]|nr:hypothetical protein [Polyangiales bacterium]